METILLYAKTTQEALMSANALCSDIKKLPDEDQHKLYLRKWPFHAMMIAPYEKQGSELVQLDRELLIYPAYREEDLEKLERGKHLVLLKNAMCVVGDNETSASRRSTIIDWLLSKVEKFPGGNFAEKS